MERDDGRITLPPVEGANAEHDVAIAAAAPRDTKVKRIVNVYLSSIRRRSKNATIVSIFFFIASCCMTFFLERGQSRG